MENSVYMKPFFFLESGLSVAITNVNAFSNTILDIF